MKTIFMILLFLVILIGFYSCSETTEPSGDPSVNVIAEMIDNVVGLNSIKSSNPDIQASTIDSIVIVDFRILLSRLKFHAMKNENDLNGVEHELKAGPFLLKLDSTGKSFTLTNGTIPEGSYSKIKFELHRFSSSEAANYVNDSIYGDFATEDRFSVIISGYIYEGPKHETFRYNGTATANLSLKFEPQITFEEGRSYTIALDIDPALIFVNNNEILDPTDPKNRNDIDNAVQNAFKSVRKK